MDSVIAEIQAALSASTTAYGPLLLVVGPQGAGKTALLHKLADQKGYPYRNLSLALSRALLDVPPPRLPATAPSVLRELVAASEASPLLLDDIELLFAPPLRLNPLRLLRDLSRLWPLIVAWPGTYHGGRLTYARPGHPEYRIYNHPDVPILPLGGEDDALP